MHFLERKISEESKPIDSTVQQASLYEGLQLASIWSSIYVLMA